jgi:RNA polymerase sigma-70 factor (ECF subfamily)
MRNLRIVSNKGMLDDTDIKELARSNRAAADDMVIRKYRQPLFQHAAYILKNYEEAIDVAQEVFIKALREKRLYDAEFKIKAWLYRVTRNLCFNMVRDRRRRSAILDSMPKKRKDDAVQDVMVFRSEQQQAMFEALQRLTKNHREILQLRYYQDLSYAEISETLDIALGTVMSRLSRAKRRLAEAIEVSGVEIA